MVLLVLIESFWLRIMVLSAVLSVIALFDFYLKRHDSKKWREYLFVLSSGVVFSILGAVHDQFTVTISPEYYAIGKGVGYESLRFKAALVGLKSGMYAGLLFGCLFLYFNKSWNRDILCKWLKSITGFAVVSLLMGATVGYVSSLLDVNIIQGSTENTRFLVVWGWHIGLYTGAILGLLFIALKPVYLSRYE
jgi:hypothetical protein